VVILTQVVVRLIPEIPVELQDELVKLHVAFVLFTGPFAITVLFGAVPGRTVLFVPLVVPLVPFVPLSVPFVLLTVMLLPMVPG